MKKKKILVILMIISCCIMHYFGNAYAAADSSKGFAEYTDEQADKETEEELKKQEKEIEKTTGKSRNNYLESLEVEGYELTPKFDKQTIDYVIKGEIKSDEIIIKATASDSKATIKGIGNIKIQPDKKQYEINVIAESGTVRTYYIYLNEQIKEEAINNLQNLEIENNMQTEETNSISENNFIGKNIFLLLLVVLIIALVIIVIKKKKVKGKHY